MGGMKILHCRDAGFDCDAVVEAETAEEILAQVREHAREVHGLDVDATVEARLEALVHDKDE